MIADVADGQVVVYHMPGIGGAQINATAMLFLPTQAPRPVGGHDRCPADHASTSQVLRHGLEAEPHIA
ncbi:hypothetical protein AB0K20_29485 [Micromonospora matsumotoense]|uniref:hypothetical protein n=1 Tax=Micromonospora matsumotoense TaxID=121616 RepID=UPI003449E105